ncbi:PREDICTED: uncharacterized protein LOC106743810 [Dinoponera quadriceps]|uniref:Uncharacterized protein LOC106743810 n=1 Tax=Dinoponera quadriceps TaxID=609295 RepID=A0A6P3X5F9_DINQU|nr:PREDICTED: uncharacterized protein LOC106743810 [Dinoponera quadriceps]
MHQIKTLLAVLESGYNKIVPTSKMDAESVSNSHVKQYQEKHLRGYSQVNEFKRGRTSIEDATCPGISKSAVTPEITDKVHDIVLTDKRVQVRGAETIGISIEQVYFNFA